MRRLTTSYNNRGLPELLTSWSTTSGSTSTDIVNQVQQDYNDFAQLTSDWQEHGGAVDTAAGAGQTLRVQYAYASGLISGSPSNFIRPTELTYPDGRTIVYTYGGNAAIDSQGRIAVGLACLVLTVVSGRFRGTSQVLSPTGLRAILCLAFGEAQPSTRRR